MTKLSDYLLESNLFIHHISQREDIDPSDFHCENTLLDKDKYLKLLDTITCTKRRHQFDVFFNRYLVEDMNDESRDLALLFAIQYYFL